MQQKQGSRPTTLYGRALQARGSRFKMAMGTRNPNIRRVLFAKETGMEQIFYAYVTKQNLLPIGYSGYRYGYILPIPAYPRVGNTRSKILNNLNP